MLFKVKIVTILFFGCLLSPQLPCSAATITDSESASHADSAANYEVVNTYSYPGFKVLQFNLAVLSHYSYMLVSNGEALVVDPGRDVFAYVDIAKKENAVIKGVLLTHSHADFVAGHIELAKVANCPIYISVQAHAVYPHEPLKEGSLIKIGQATIKVLETPGHTLDCTTSLVYGADNLETPHTMFTGDTLFVGSIGRPDLMGGQMSAAALASHAFDSWTNKLSKLPDSVVILPAHGAGSLCGAHLSDEPSSTIGQERKTNSYLQLKSRSAFIAAILDGLPEAPQYFKHNAAMNREGPPLVDWEAFPSELKSDMLLTDSKFYYVVDLRDAKEYAAGHIPNSVNIGLRGRLETWVGIMVPWDAKLVLVGNSDELKEAVRRLHRVGYKGDVISFAVWKNAGLALNKNELVDPKFLYQKMQSGDAPVIVDVRLPNEWMALRIGDVVNLPINHLAELSSKLDPEQPVVAVCNSAYRSSMAMGILERQGFKKATSLNGGSEAWIQAGLPVYEAQKMGTSSSASSTAVKREIKLPEKISAETLKSLLMDLPGTFDLVDIRPANQFSDYNLPGSRNVDIAELVNNPAFLVGNSPLIVVDRDGSLAAVCAGMLFTKTQRPIKFLQGGLQTYWGAIDSPLKSSAPFNLSPQNMNPPSTVAPVIPTGTPTDNKPQPPKKKSAGC